MTWILWALITLGAAFLTALAEAFTEKVMTRFNSA